MAPGATLGYGWTLMPHVPTWALPRPGSVTPMPQLLGLIAGGVSVGIVIGGREIGGTVTGSVALVPPVPPVGPVGVDVPDWLPVPGPGVVEVVAGGTAVVPVCVRLGVVRGAVVVGVLGRG